MEVGKLNPIRKMIRESRFTLAKKFMKVVSPTYYRAMMNGGIFDSQLTPRPMIKFLKETTRGRELGGVEVGVNKGENSESILNELNVKYLGLVDIWDEYTEEGVKGNYSGNYEIVKQKFDNNPKVEILKIESVKASFKFADNSLDFVYIDANHEYEHVYNDIEAWTPKIKNMGVVGGHDYPNLLGVIRAVNDYCVKNKQKFIVHPPDWFFVKGL